MEADIPGESFENKTQPVKIKVNQCRNGPQITDIPSKLNIDIVKVICGDI